jgi:hypothetical protein
MSKYVFVITVVLSMALNFILFVELGTAGKTITNLKMKNAQLVKESDNSLQYLINQCRLMMQACNKE